MDFKQFDSDEDLEQEMVKDNNEYKRKITLGRKVYKILGRTDIEQGSLTLDRKEALDIYMAHNAQNKADQHSLELTTTNQRKRKINTTIKKELKKRKEKTEAVRKAKHLKLEEIKLSEVLSQGTTFHRQMSGVAQQTFLIQNNTMNTNNSAVVTPVELNKNLLNTLFKFNPLSKLKRFLVNKTGVEKTYYSLAEILTILKNIIRGEGMFDHANPSVIICSTDLEKALNMKALHVTEIRDLVLSQITKVPDQSLREKFTQKIPHCGRTTINVSRTNLNLEAPRDSQPQPPRIIRTANISPAIYTDKNAKFTLKPKFLKVVQLVPGTDLKQTIFSYEEVTLLLSKYILSRKDDIFDPRNIKLAIVANDPIGDAFGVKAFHRCQVNNLLRSQLIPVNPTKQKQ